MIDTHIDLHHQDGQWFKPITPKEAFDMRLDVQLYELNLFGEVVPDPDTPEEWREKRTRTRTDTRKLQCSTGRSKYTPHGPYNSFYSPYWCESRVQWFIKVDPLDKPEYEPGG